MSFGRRGLGPTMSNNSPNSEHGMTFTSPKTNMEFKHGGLEDDSWGLISVYRIVRFHYSGWLLGPRWLLLMASSRSLQLSHITSYNLPCMN